MSRAIITYAAGEHEKLLAIALPTFERFAKKHGYKLFVGEKLTERPAAWNKIKLLQRALEIYDEVVWLDADLVIIDDTLDFPRHPTASHQMVRHFTGLSEVPNSGVWIVRRAILPLLDKIWELEVFTNHGWWEQAALLTLMGYSVPAEGSDFGKTKCRCVWPTKWAKEVAFMRLEWNSHPCYRSPKPRIVHCSYPDMQTRINVMEDLVKDAKHEYPEWPEKGDE